jgi:hypothetical protein
MCSCSEEHTKTLLINLNALGQIKPGYKLNSKEKYIELDDSTLYQGVLRMYRGDSRKASVEMVDGIVEQTELLINRAIDQKNNEEEMGIFLNGTAFQFLELIYPKIREAIVGIKNLKDNYNADTTISSKFDLNIIRLSKKQMDVEHHLKII